MVPVLLASASAFLFGGLAVALRFALRVHPDAEVGALVTTIIGLAVPAAVALVTATRQDGVTLRALLPFLAAGVIGPGISQVLFVRAVKEAGPSRTAVWLGVAPVVSAAIAISLLDEPLRAALLAGTALIVLGSVLLVRERVRPETFRRIGVVLALGAAVCFATRDNILRWLSTDTDVTPMVAGCAILFAGSVTILAYLLATGGRRRLARFGRPLRAFALGGLLFGASYALLFEAYYRGRVTVVSPLVATESLWGVVLSALIVGRSELIGPRLVTGASLIVAGGALIAVFR